MSFSIEQTNRFEARDANGNRHVIVESTRFQTFNSNPGGSQKTAGTKELKTADGHLVDRVCKGRYVLQPEGLALVSDDESAS